MCANIRNLMKRQNNSLGMTWRVFLLTTDDEYRFTCVLASCGGFILILPKQYLKLY